MTVDNSFTMKKFQSMEIIYVTFSQITKLPYVECDPETFDDQVYMFTEEEAAKEFAKSYVEKNTPLLTVKVLRKQMPNFYMGLYAEGVNMVIFHEGDQTRRIELEQIFPKPDMEKMNKQHLPVLNPGVQLTVVYFLQELRKPNQRRDDAERMQHLRELEEEMLVNLMRSKFILAIDISQVQGEFDPANPGPDVRIPYIKNQNEDIFQPLFSDIGEFQKFRPDPQAKLRLAAIPFQHLLPYLMKQAKGFVINPSGFNLLLTREQLQRIMGAQAQSVRPNLEAMMAQAAAAQAQKNAQNNAANDEVKEHVRLLNEKSDTVRWCNKESLIPHPRLNRFVTVHKESAKGSQLDGLGISCFLHKHTAFQRCMLAIGNFQPSFKGRTGSVSIANELTTDIHMGQSVRDTTSVCNRNQ